MFVKNKQNSSVNFLVRAEFLTARPVNLHFDIHFVSCSYEGKFRGHFGFFLSNLLVSNV